MSSEDSSGTGCEARDILASPWRTLLVFGLPTLAIVATATPAFTNTWRTIIWGVALGIMGVGCVVNALRCARVHCYVTGPFFLLMALLSLLYGFGLLPLGRNGWNLIGLVVLIGAVVLCCVPEMFLGRYRNARANEGKRE